MESDDDEGDLDLVMVGAALLVAGQGSLVQSGRPVVFLGFVFVELVRNVCPDERTGRHVVLKFRHRVGIPPQTESMLNFFISPGPPVLLLGCFLGRLLFLVP